MKSVPIHVVPLRSHFVTHSPEANIGISRGVSITLRNLIPIGVVLICSIVGPVMDHHECPTGTDGPQFRCWLQQQDP